MDTVKFVPMLVGLLLAVVMVGAVFVPVVQSSTTRIVTTEIENEGAEWLKLGYNEGAANFSFTVGFETVTVDNVESEIFKVGNQTGDYEDMICYADSQRTLFVSGDYWYLLTNGESPSVHKFTDTASVTKSSGTLTILDGSDTVYTGASPSWAYVPDANGVYGVFYNGGLTLEEDKPTVAVGSYGGAFAYNDTVVALGNVPLDLVKNGNYADGEVTWILAPSELDSLKLVPLDTLEPSVIDFDPISIQPIDLDSGNGVGLMTADPTTGTQVGDLYYTFTGTNARVVGYSSSIDWSTFNAIPDTVTYNGVTYTVDSIGTSAFSGCTNLALTSLPDTITFLGGSAFSGCTNLALTSLPEGLTTISSGAFTNCTSLALTSLPGSVTNINSNAFRGCTSLALTSLPEGITAINGGTFDGCTSLALTSLPEGVTVIDASAFLNCSGLEVMTLHEGITTIYNDAFKGCTNLSVSPLPLSLTNIGTGVFYDCPDLTGLVVLGTPTFKSTTFAHSSIKEVLNLGGANITTTSYGLNADSVQDYISPLGYIAPTSIHETEVVPIDSPVAGLMQMLPLIAGIGALFLAVGTMIYTRF